MVTQIPSPSSPSHPQGWPPRPPELATWHPRWRERWGERANDLESEGIPFPESERRAFAEVKAEKAKPVRIAPRAVQQRADAPHDRGPHDQQPSSSPAPAQEPRRADRDKQGALSLASR